jgi:hypothetical protein
LASAPLATIHDLPIKASTPELKKLKPAEAPRRDGHFGANR